MTTLRLHGKWWWYHEANDALVLQWRRGLFVCPRQLALQAVSVPLSGRKRGEPWSLTRPLVIMPYQTTIARKTPESFSSRQVRQGVLPNNEMGWTCFERKNMQEQIVLTRIPTGEVGAHIGERVLVTGWLHSWREMGSVSFLVLRDGWGTLQMVAETEEELKPLRERGASLESVIAVSGLVVAMPQAPGGFELHELCIEVITPVSEALIVPLNKPTLKVQVSTLLDHASVLNRHPARRAILRLGAGAMQAFRAVLNERRFTEIQTPKLVAAATESGANVFAVDYFGRPAYLAQSPQF